VLLPAPLQGVLLKLVPSLVAEPLQLLPPPPAEPLLPLFQLPQRLSRPAALEQLPQLLPALLLPPVEPLMPPPPLLDPLLLLPPPQPLLLEPLLQRLLPWASRPAMQLRVPRSPSPAPHFPLPSLAAPVARPLSAGLPGALLLPPLRIGWPRLPQALHASGS
jgi:hypothetical protein